MKHADGMSSDDEMSSLDQSTLGKVRQDVENQARTGKLILLKYCRNDTISDLSEKGTGFCYAKLALS